jgi:glycosyltransferase involved in cell wall biosynthesis
VTQRTVDIIIAALADAAAAQRCVRSVVASRNTTPQEVIVVTPDAGVARAIASVDAAGAAVTVLCERNLLDHADAVNRGLALHADRDAVVVQSTAEVAGDWLDRLAAHAAVPGVGVVGTFTQVAGIAAYPISDPPGPARATDALAALDDLFSRVNRGRSASVTGAYGPCLYITRGCLASIGGLRSIAAEPGPPEVDFSLRARDAGFDTRIAGDTFVVDDGPDAGGAYLQQRAPGADPDGNEPQHAQDTLRLLAGRVDVARLAASPRPGIVFISHAWGGGIRRHMNDLAALVRGHADVLYLEPADAHTVKLYLPREGERFAAWFRLPEDLSTLARTLRTIGVARLHFHHVHGLPESILRLPAESGLPYDCTLHDYYPICAQYHLADEHGRYCARADGALCDRCLGGRPAQWNLDLDAWRRTLGELLRGAARVIAPSHDVAARVGRYLPGLSIDVWPHAERPVEPPRDVVRVVTLGVLSPEKGLDVVARCAEDAKRRGLPLTFRVLGSTTVPIPQSPVAPLTILGSYDEHALPQLLAGEHADVLFFPAQVPETYSYTLSIALATRLPVVASALGAFSERLAGLARTRVLPWDATAEQWNAALLDAARPAIDGSETGAPLAADPVGASP